MERRIFEATMDRSNARLTYIFGYGIFVALPIVLCIIFWFVLRDPDIFFLPIASVVITALFLSWRITRFEITEEYLIVRRIMNSIRIPLRDIVSVSGDVGGIKGFTIRVFGSHGIYGSQGIFWNKGLGGMFRAYVMNKDNLVRLTMRNGRYIFLSPDPKDEFLQVITARIADR